jgi:hypothetical protein
MKIKTFTEYMSESVKGGYGSDQPLEDARARLRRFINPEKPVKTVSARTEEPRRQRTNQPPKKSGTKKPGRNP